ncbi:MAG: radical SAM family heme chaperone HemW [Magnetococcales bacterium]|nr:radical SAM family heme chaperone HemW [Magnetococcales bacterium]
MKHFSYYNLLLNDSMYLNLPLTLYIHIPFCQHKCPYCDFRSEVMPVWPEAEYMAALQRELAWRCQQLADDRRPLHALFIGGGTPSLLAAESVAALLDGVQKRWQLAEGCEITLEANPESASLDKMRAWRQMGINRLSLGVQAFDQARLSWLERPHDLATARQAIRHAQQLDFTSVNVDLIYATPGHTEQQWQQELAEAMEWGVQHLSCYALTVERGTPLHRRWQQQLWSPLDEEQESRLFCQTRTQLQQGGWHGYEISNFAREGHRCRHNCNYWAYGDYLGVGLAAHGKWMAADGSLLRSCNHGALSAYLAALADDTLPEQQHPFGQTQTLSPQEVGQEMILLGLRYDGGVERRLYRQLTGSDLVEQQRALLTLWQEAGWVEWNEQRVRLTEQGYLRTDALISRLH